MSCLCVHDQPAQTMASTVRVVRSLLQICSDYLIEQVVPPQSWTEVGNKFSLEVLCQDEILVEVQKFWFGRLPSSLAHKMLGDALLKHDNQQGIQRLLIIYLCLIENLRCSQLVTPLYLYRWTEGRVMLLEKLLETDVLHVCKDLSLDMYNFYHRPHMVQPWTYDVQPELELYHDLDRVRLTSREEALVEDLLSRGSHLLVLKLHTVCTDQMLGIVSQTCLCLAVLDVSFARNVTDSGIAILCRSGASFTKTIQQIQLEGTSTTSQGIHLLLENCRNLVNIESSMMEEFLYNMQAFLSESSTFDTTIATGTRNSYKLKHLSLCIRKYSDVSPSIIELVSQIFKNLEEIQIHFVHPKQVHSLKFLKNLHNLQSLMVGVVSLEFIQPGLESIGRNLVTFRYVFYGGESGQINISLIQQNCRNLQTLSVSGNCLVSDHRFSQQRNELFPHLTDLHINTHSFIPFPIWSGLLSQCSSLSQVDLTSCQGLTDTSLTQILASHPHSLAKLVKLSIRGGHRGDVALTEKSVVMINTRCCLLTQLGDCLTWSLYASSPTVDALWEREDGTRGLR